MSLHNLVEELLRRGLDDWVDATEVAWVARSVGGATSEAEVRDLSLRVLRELLGRDLMDVGMVTETGFTAWKIPVDQALQQIESEWLALPKGPDLGDICWLNLTKKGSIEAGELLSKRVPLDQLPAD